LAQCYERCLELVEQHTHKTIAFPSIGTGAHCFPLDRAARISLRGITNFLRRNRTVEM
jgi:O-acetyl-ADP-ribose deacetylase (regulator of RNase III)